MTEEKEEENENLYMDVPLNDNEESEINQLINEEKINDLNEKNENFLKSENEEEIEKNDTEMKNEVKKEKNYLKSENEEEESMMKYQKNLEIYKKLTNSLKSTCLEIEKTLNSIYYSKKTPQQINTKNNKIPIDNDYKEIKLYKDKIEEIRKKLDIIIDVNKIDELESSEFDKKKIYESLKKEKSYSQSNTIDKNNKDNEQRYEIINLNNKISNLKEQIRIKKEYLEISQIKIQKQNIKIKNIENQCKTINENIQYKKKKDISNFKEFHEELNLDYIQLDKSKQKSYFKSMERIYINLIKEKKELKDKLESKIDFLLTEIMKIDENITLTKQELEKRKKSQAIESYIPDKNINLKNLKKKRPNKSVILDNKYIPFNSNSKVIKSPFNISPLLCKQKVFIHNNQLIHHLKSHENLKHNINKHFRKESLNDKYILTNKKNENTSNQRYLAYSNSEKNI